MTTSKLISFKDFILSKNTYFDSGYAVAFKDAESKRIIVRNGTDFIPVMPNDTLGNYFYIRYNGSLAFNEAFGERMADCGPSRTTYNDRQPINIVAIVKDADEYTLLNNLRNTCAVFTVFTPTPTGAILVPEQVIQDEMSGAAQADIAAALQRIGSRTIVSLTVNIQDNYTPNKCINDPCKC